MIKLKKDYIYYFIYLIFLSLIFSCTNQVDNTVLHNKLKTEIRQSEGKPTLFVNNEPHHGLFCSVPMNYMQNFIDAGFDVFDTHPFTPHGWVGEDQYDYTDTDTYIESYLKQKPDALLILRIWMGYNQSGPGDWINKPDWYVNEHPDAAIQTTHGPQGQDDHVLVSPSFASADYREKAGIAIKNMIEHVESKYGNNILGYVVGGGPCGEWFHWFAYYCQRDQSPELLDDYSEPMKKTFIAFAKEKYRTIADVNKTWHTDYQTFEDITLPGIESRLNATIGNIRDGRQEQKVLDFYHVFNRQTINNLLHWTAKAKEGCRNQKVIMAFYGYLWHNQDGVVQARSGHIDLDMALSSPDIDYIIAPSHYTFRQLEGVISGQGVVSSTLFREKQYIQEIDGSTFLKKSWPCTTHANPVDIDETIHLLKRDLGKVLTEGSSAWIMDLMGGMYDDPELIQELKQITEIAKTHYHQTGHNNKQVAVVLNPDESFYFKEAEQLLVPLISMFKQYELERMGLGYDDLILEDLKYLSQEQTERYKFWIFPSAISLSDEEIRLIRKHCMRNDNYILWNYAPAVWTENGLNLERMKELTGFDCGYTLEPGEAIVKIAKPTHPILEGLDLPITFGTNGDLSRDDIKYHACLGVYPSNNDKFNVTPRFYIKKADQTLGDLVSYQNGKYGGFGLKDMGNWTSVLSTVPLTPNAILRNIARAAGCHVYSDILGQTFHCKNYIGMFFHEDGECQIKLPYRVDVVKDVWTNQEIARNVDKLDLTVKKNNAVLYTYSR
ncbi:beta-galactosidase [candidate division KSB1 bacterium]|nr:beta-galactosidase [candidate division KSB1 bacterium]